MAKTISINIPDWMDEKEIMEIIEKYIELKLPDSVTRQEYIKFMKINLEEIVELNEEIKILKKLREKAKERCQF